MDVKNFASTMLPEDGGNHSAAVTAQYQMSGDGFRIALLGKTQSVMYPSNIFSSQTSGFKKVLVENFIYSRVKSLCLELDQIFHYGIAKPVVRELVEYGIRQDLPRLAWLSKIKTQDLMTVFERNRTNEVFSSSQTSHSTLPRTDTTDSAILALSFGKDSLLSYGLAQELGLAIRLVYVKEMVALNQPEERFKREIMSDCCKKEKVEIEFLSDTIDEIFLSNHRDRTIEDLENTNSMLAFTLELIPFAYHYRARYILFGNEANFSDFYQNQGFRVYPDFTQSAAYAATANQFLDRFTGESVRVASLVEPIYNLVEVAILVHRYPWLLRYLMSCSPPAGSRDRWCYDCPMCAKAFLYLVAVGGKPEHINFNQNFFNQQYQRLYPLFNDTIERVYEKPPAVRDKHLLSFLLAYRRGAQGELIERFRSQYLSEAERRESELRQKFLGLHQFVTVPDAMRSQLTSIYQEEINRML